MRSLLVLALLASLARLAHAEEKDPSVTVSVEPMFLIIGMVEANVELKVAPHVGMQGIAGYGSIMFTGIKDLGGEVNVYARPELAGFHAGAMVKYLWGSASLPFVDNMNRGDVVERQLGLYVGWKWIGWGGVSAVLQMGIGKLDLTGGDEPVHEIVPVANLTAGYSF